jgi:tRNA 2-selenouridine synthase
MNKTIKVTEAIIKGAIFIDTRTSKEFSEDHLPGAINLPILSNEERHVVGITYKQVSKDKAIEKGIEYFSKKLPKFMQEINKYKDKQIIFYCWRGGMRSKAVVSLLDSLNYNVLQLEGGYKAYRTFVREELTNYKFKPKLIVLWGLTCTGKTELLNKLLNSIDLEGLAQHRGSLYGAIGLQPNSQKRFENLLLQKLNQLNNEKVVFIEGESKKIGDVQIPPFLYKMILHGTHVLVTKSLDKRAEFAVTEYFSNQNSIKQIKEVTKSLFKVISKKRQSEVIDFLEKKKFQAAAKILLEYYYDPLYNHTLKQRNFSHQINNDNIDEAVSKLKLIYQEDIP